MSFTTWFYVGQDRKLEDGTHLLCERLSRPLKRISTAKRVLKRLRRSNAAAYVVEVKTLTRLNRV